MAKPDKLGLPASEWERFFRLIRARVEELDACKSAQAKAVKIGHVLSPLVGRQARIRVKDRTGTATLCREDARGRERRYYLRVRWDDRTTGRHEAPVQGAALPVAPAGGFTPTAAAKSKQVDGSTTQTCTSARTHKPVNTPPKERGNNEKW